MKKMTIGIIIGGMIFGAIGVIASTTISSKNVTYQDKTVNNALDELYNEATTGKELVAAAITNKGISTTSNDTYETMAANINNIESAYDISISKVIANYSIPYNLNRLVKQFNHVDGYVYMTGINNLSYQTVIGTLPSDYIPIHSMYRIPCVLRNSASGATSFGTVNIGSDGTIIMDVIPTGYDEVTLSLSFSTK